MKRGFTLIELLAVLTVLSIIMLITVPVVAGIIKNSKEKTREQSVELYGRAIENAISAYYVKYPLENEVTLETLETEKLIDYKGNKVECNIVRIEERDVYLEDCKVGNKNVNATYGKYIPETATTEDYRGYYADVDGDGNPDGVIYADLGANIEYPQSGQFGDSDETYSYNKATGELNEYTISKDKHTGEKAKFGENKIIKLKKNKNNPRFYVMALEDFTIGSFEEGNSEGAIAGAYYWYNESLTKLVESDTSTNFEEGYNNTGTIIAIWNKNGIGEGSYLGATQDDHDIWKHIQTKYQEGWYIPSRGEWAAFAYYFTNNERVETKLTTSNYGTTYGLSSYYWSSSVYDSDSVWYVSFPNCVMDYDFAGSTNSVRLGTTF